MLVPGSAITAVVRPGTDSAQVSGVRVYKSVMRLVIIGTTGRGSGTETAVLLVAPDISLVLISKWIRESFEFELYVEVLELNMLLGLPDSSPSGRLKNSKRK